MVTLLLSAYQEINVLAPSMTSAKKSILSEGYDCGNADILNSLLQHSSAKALETEDGKAGAEGADGTNGAADEGELDANGLPAETKEQYVEEKESPVSAADLETQESLNKLKV